MSEFDRFLPHLKKINHRHPVFELQGDCTVPVSKAHFLGEIAGIAANTGCGPAKEE